MPPDKSRGRTLSSRARGNTTDPHGPLQRLLDVVHSTTRNRYFFAFWLGSSAGFTYVMANGPIMCT
jgi:hypothetical protein